MCGIVAWAGKSASKFNKAKFDLVGSYNEERGIDSCGVASNGIIELGVHNNKVFRDFITNVGYKIPVEIPTVIGHTRKATGGAHNEDNAHPFGFGILDNNMFEFIGVHNGSLFNHHDLAKQFNVDIKEYYKPHDKKSVVRDKIDSEILLESIYKNKNWNILSHYLGAAALVFQDLNNPNVIYCWHGASKKYANDNADIIYEERPLFYYQETRNSVYISSMENSLEAIGGIKDKTVFEFTHNTLYKITDGNVSKAELTEISRKKCYHVKSYSNNNNCNYPTGKNYNNVSKFNLDGCLVDEDDIIGEYYDPRLDCSLRPPQQQYKLPLAANLRPPNINLAECNIYNEKKPKVNFITNVFYWKLRFWKDNDLITGCYIWVPNFGYYFLSATYERAVEQFWFLTNKEFFQGDFCFTNQEFTEDDGAYVPFPHSAGEDEIINIPQIFFFYKGIALLTKQDYDIVMSLDKVKAFAWDVLTYCSSYPTIDIGYGIKTIGTQNIRFKDELVTDTICPLGSSRIYTIKEGNCVLIEDVVIVKDLVVDKETKEVDDLEDIVTLLETNEDAIQQTERSISIVNDKSSDLLEKTIESIFKTPFTKIPMDISLLQEYGNKERAVDAIIILENFLKEARALLNLELKE